MLKKQRPAPLSEGPGACSKCFNYSCTFSALIRPCSCESNPYIHELCLEKHLKSLLAQNSIAISNSEFDGLLQYKCPLCENLILFRKDFIGKIVFCSIMTTR